MNRIMGKGLQSTGSLADQAYKELISRITKLEYSPGSVLGEKTLIEELNIGRTPIREALQRLALEGLVVHQLNRGMFVAEITYKDVQEIYEFRSLIDGHACRLAASRASPVQASKLYQIHLELVAATKANDIDRYVQADRDFYSVLSEAVGKLLHRKQQYPESLICICDCVLNLFKNLETGTQLLNRMK